MIAGRIPTGNASSSCESEEDVSQETKRLRCHLGLGESPGMPFSSIPPECVPLFFIECAPDTNNGARCKIPSCPDRIESGQYRVARNHGMGGPAWVPSSNSNSGTLKCDHESFLIESDFVGS